MFLEWFIPIIRRRLQRRRLLVAQVRNRAVASAGHATVPTTIRTTRRFGLHNPKYGPGQR